MKNEFFKELHNKEFERREHLDQRANTIVTRLSLLGSVFVYMAINYNPATRLVNLIIGFLLLICFALICISIIYLARSYRVPHLVDISGSKEWRDYWNIILKKPYPSIDNKYLSAEDEFNDCLIGQYVYINEKNICSNTDKGNLLVKSNNALLATLFILLITSVAFYYNNIWVKK